jgi:hypothetical protein
MAASLLVNDGALDIGANTNMGSAGTEFDAGVPACLFDRAPATLITAPRQIEAKAP